MKSWTTTLLLGALLPACGTPASTVSEATTTQSEEGRLLSFVDGQIAEVRHTGVTDQESPSTVVVVEYTVPCHMELSPVMTSVQVNAQDGRITLVSSALAKGATHPGRAVCLAFSTHQETIRVSDEIVDASLITLVNLNNANPSAQFRANDTDWIESLPVELIGTRPLCPPGKTCIINGTIVTLEKTLTCGDEGPTAYHLGKTGSEKDKLELSIAAYGLVPLNHFAEQCSSKTIRFDLTLLGTFAEPSDIALNVLRYRPGR